LDKHIVPFNVSNIYCYSKIYSNCQRFFISSSVVIDGIHVHCQEEELKRGKLEADKDKMMREYRAQLDAERAQKLANRRNHSRSNSKSSSSKKGNGQPTK
jgi:hypothetical protein